MTTLNLFLNGAIMMGFLVAALFFLRFWRKSAERLFAIFAAAFFVLAVERMIMLMIVSTQPEAEFRPYIYIARLVAFTLIIVAIVDKNRSARRR